MCNTIEVGIAGIITGILGILVGWPHKISRSAPPYN